MPASAAGTRRHESKCRTTPPASMCFRTQVAVGDDVVVNTSDEAHGHKPVAHVEEIFIDANVRACPCSPL
jgi:hypothetical protein